MGRDASRSVGNIWREARLEAAKYDESLANRENVAERLGIGIDAVRRIENNVNKVMPVDTAVLMADLYNCPELKNYYCLHECPIGRDLALADSTSTIERVTVKLLKRLNVERLDEVKDRLIEIAEDGVINDDEVDDLNDVMSYLESLSRTINELKLIGQKITKRKR